MSPPAGVPPPHPIMSPKLAATPSLAIVRLIPTYPSMVVGPQCEGLEDHVKRGHPRHGIVPEACRPTFAHTARRSIRVRRVIHGAALHASPLPSRDSTFVAITAGLPAECLGRVTRDHPDRASPRHQYGGFDGMRRAGVRGAASTKAPNATSGPHGTSGRGGEGRTRASWAERASVAATTREEDRRREEPRRAEARVAALWAEIPASMSHSTSPAKPRVPRSPLKSAVSRARIRGHPVSAELSPRPRTVPRAPPRSGAGHALRRTAIA